MSEQVVKLLLTGTLDTLQMTVILQLWQCLLVFRLA